MAERLRGLGRGIGVTAAVVAAIAALYGIGAAWRHFHRPKHASAIELVRRDVESSVASTLFRVKRCEPTGHVGDGNYALWAEDERLAESVGSELLGDPVYSCLVTGLPGHSAQLWSCYAITNQPGNRVWGLHLTGRTCQHREL